jgi:hypothetical protein
MTVPTAAQQSRRRHCAALASAALLLACCSLPARAQEVKVVLSGDQEIPPVATPASGTGTFSVAPDRSVRGSVTIKGVEPTVAHIHEAEAGKIGAIIIPLVKTGDNVWSVPEGAKLSEAQYASFKAGNLYFNVHSAAHRGGEIRGQIKP